MSKEELLKKIAEVLKGELIAKFEETENGLKISSLSGQTFLLSISEFA